jgi:hypothetical protein
LVTIFGQAATDSLHPLVKVELVGYRENKSRQNGWAWLRQIYMLGAKNVGKKSMLFGPF